MWVCLDVIELYSVSGPGSLSLTLGSDLVPPSGFCIVVGREALGEVAPSIFGGVSYDHIPIYITGRPASPNDKLVPL